MLFRVGLRKLDDPEAVKQGGYSRGVSLNMFIQTEFEEDQLREILSQPCGPQTDIFINSATMHGSVEISAPDGHNSIGVTI